MDWEELRRAYRTGDMTLRALAASRGVNYNTLKARARRESWSRETESDADEAAAKGGERLQEAGDALLERVLSLLDECTDMRQLQAAASVLKNIKDLQMLQSPLEDEEQRLRIAKLRAGLEQELNRSEPVEVVFLSDTGEAAQ